MHVRAGTAADAPAMARIQRASPEAAQWEVAGDPVLIAETDGEIAGFLVWRPTAPDESEILNLAVDPTFRRLGVALALISAVPNPIIFLEVRESNTPARALYRSAGFTDSGVRFGYYQNPPEAAIVMRLKR
jgi:ribosomal-protein-alanine N-acetyltransferase